MDMEQIARFFDRDKLAKFLDIELVEVSPGQATTRMTIQEKHYNGVNITHGGAIFTLADYAFAAASNAHGTVAVAINVSISFLKSARTGTLWAEAREISRNPKLATYTVEVKDDSGDLVALFQGMVYRKKDPIPAEPPA